MNGKILGRAAQQPDWWKVARARDGAGVSIISRSDVLMTGGLMQVGDTEGDRDLFHESE